MVNTMFIITIMFTRYFCVISILYSVLVFKSVIVDYSVFIMCYTSCIISYIVIVFCCSTIIRLFYYAIYSIWSILYDKYFLCNSIQEVSFDTSSTFVIIAKFSEYLVIQDIFTITISYWRDTSHFLCFS